MSLKTLLDPVPIFLPDTSLRLGCGVTAYSYDDALLILRDTTFKGRDVPPEDEVLDQKHKRQAPQAANSNVSCASATVEKLSRS